MIRWISLLLFCLIGQFTEAQIQIDRLPFDAQQVLTYEKAWETPGTKVQLYQKTKRWILANFEKLSLFIQFTDTSEGMISCKGITPYFYCSFQSNSNEVKQDPVSVLERASYVMQLFFTDDRVKMRLTEVVMMKNESRTFSYKTVNYDLVEQINTACHSSEIRDQALAKTNAAKIQGIDDAIKKILSSFNMALKEQTITGF